MKELFFTLGVVNSFTLIVVGLSVDVSQFGRFKYCITQSVKVGFGSVFTENRGFGFKTDPALAPSAALNARGVAQYTDFGAIEGHITETVQDRR